MSRFLLPTAVLLLAGGLLARTDERGWSVRELPDLEPPKEQVASADEVKEIKKLIQELAATDAPAPGYCSTIAWGYFFAPRPELDFVGGWTSSPENHQRSKALSRLVEIGPK